MTWDNVIEALRIQEAKQDKKEVKKRAAEQRRKLKEAYRETKEDTALLMQLVEAARKGERARAGKRLAERDVNPVVDKKDLRIQ